MVTKSAVKYIQSLQHKKFRDAYGRFVAEGPKLVDELLELDAFPCEMVYATKDWKQPPGINSQIKVEVIENFELEKISGLSQPNQVVAIFEKKTIHPDPKKSAGWIIALENIQDPGNLGTIIRIADWFGIDHIICSHGTADVYNPKVVQSTMASLARVHISYHDLAEILPALNRPIIAATLGGSSLDEFQIKENGVLLIGNESKGISEDLQKIANHNITIPRRGKAESLNAAVATGILLYGLMK